MGGTRASGLSHSTDGLDVFTHQRIFFKVLGQHIQDAGLPTIWIESGILGPRTVERVLVGKDYNKGTRVHKRALFRRCGNCFCHTELFVYLEEKDNELKQSLEKSVRTNKDKDFLKLLDLVSSDKFRTALYSFIAIKKEKNPNLKCWWRYMEMVGILLLFVKAQIEGIWELHLFAFQKMLPFFHRYI